MRQMTASLALIAWCAMTPVASAAETAPLVVYVVRHAEKVISEDRNPPLTEDGEARAARLAVILKDVKLTGVHSTDYKRTQSTAAPTAKAKGLDVQVYDPRKPDDLIAAMRKAGGHHLVVGHSNTSPALVEKLGADPGPAIEEKTEYDRLYVVVEAARGSVTGTLLRYGKQ